MTPVTRSNVSLDALTVDLIDVLEAALKLKRSEIVRQGVGAYFLQMEKVLLLLADEQRKQEIKALAKAIRSKR